MANNSPMGGMCFGSAPNPRTKGTLNKVLFRDNVDKEEASSIDFNYTGTAGIDISEEQNGSVLVHKNGDCYSISACYAPKDSDRLFYDFVNLKALDASGLDTSKVEVMSYMFALCEQLGELDLSTFDTSKVTDMDSMFKCCMNLSRINMSSFDTSNVEYTCDVFVGCRNLNGVLTKDEKLLHRLSDIRMR